MSVIYLIIGIVLFVSLVVLHEAGHAFAAWRNGVKVEEFGIGFPPRIWSKPLKNGTLFSINLLPIGGFVRLNGEHDAATGPHTYGGARLWAKTKILLAGVAVNWLIAAIIFTILALTGMPQLIPNQFSIPADTVVSQQQVVVAEVIADSPALKAGLQNGDTVLAVNGQAMATATQVASFMKIHAGQTVHITYERDNQQHMVSARLHANNHGGQGYAGIALGERTQRRSTWSAPIVGAGVTVQFTWATVQGLGTLIGQLFHHQFQQAGQSVAGPVGIFSILQSFSQIGFSSVLFLIGIISLTLAVMNSLPIPALDGGRLAVTLFFRLCRMQLTKSREETIQAIGFSFLMLLIVVVTIADVGKLVR